MHFPAYQFIGARYGDGLGHAGQKFIIANVPADFAHHPQDGFLHAFDFLDQVIFGPEGRLQSIFFFLGNALF